MIFAKTSVNLTKKILFVFIEPYPSLVRSIKSKWINPKPKQDECERNYRIRNWHSFELGHFGPWSCLISSKNSVVNHQLHRNDEVMTPWLSSSRSITFLWSLISLNKCLVFFARGTARSVYWKFFSFSAPSWYYDTFLQIFASFLIIDKIREKVLHF